MTKRKSLIATFAFVLALSLALFFGITLFGGTLTAQAEDVSSYVTVNAQRLNSGNYLESNESSSVSKGAETEPANYVAWYKDGVLTLNGYNGGQISIGEDLTIKLKGNNTITSKTEGVFVSSCENLIIDADSNATLNINVTSTESDVFGISVGYASGTTGNVTIQGKAKVNIVCQTTNYKAFGIYSKYVTGIVDEASLDIKCVSEMITSGDGASYGIYSEHTPVFNTSGTIKIDTSECATASYCVYSAANVLDLQNGDCLLKYKKATSRSFASYPRMANTPDGYVMRTSLKNGEDVLKKGTAHTVTVKNGNDYFGSTTNQYVEGEIVSINTEKKDLEFKKWIGEGVTFTEENATKKETSFVMPAGDVTVTADYNVFLKQPVFKRKNDTNGSVSFRVANEPYGNYYCIKFIKESGEEIERTFIKDETSEAFTYYYDVGTFYFDKGNYMICVEYGGYYFYSEPFEIDYTDKTPAANVSDVIVSGKTGREITPVNFDVTLSYATFKAITEGTDVSSWFNYLTGGLVAKISAVSEGATSATITISGKPTATATSSAICVNIPKEVLATGNDNVITTKYNSNAKFNIVKPASYSITVKDGRARVDGVVNSVAQEGATITIEANKKDLYVFDKWVVVSGDVALAAVNSDTTTFVMPESDVEIKATYKEIVYSVQLFVTAPVKDKTADTTYMAAYGTGYTATKVEWYKGEGVVSSMLMGASDKFIAGEKYTVVVTVTLNPGYVFVDGSTLSKSINKQAATLNSDSVTDTITIKTTFTVPTDPIPEHNVTVENGKISGGATTGTFAEGASVTVTANAPASDMMFDKWTATGITLSSEQLSSQTFTFTMGTNDVTLTATYKAIPKYTVTITDGKLTGGATTGSFKAGESITITADAKEGFTFDKWTATGITLTSEQLSSQTFTFTMGTNDVKLTATYKPIPQYTVTVVDGKLADDTTSGSFKQGSSVTITADTKEGFVFDKWTATGITLTSEQLSSVTITITVVTNSITLTATYTEVVAPAQKYKVTVENGSADGDEFKMGQVVTITADAAPEGKEFDKWVVVSGGVTLVNENDKETTFVMPESDVEIKATYKDVVVPTPKHNVTIENGTNSGGEEIEVGQTVTITAGEAPEGKEFDKWVVVSGEVTLTDINSATTTFVMPDGAVEIKATYKDKTPSGGGEEPGGEIKPTPASKGLSGGAIAGIVVGSVAVAGIGGFAIFWFAIKKKSFANLIAAIKGLFKKK